MSSVKEIVNQVFNKYLQMSLRDQKINDIRELVKELVKEGVLQERISRETVGWNPSDGAAYLPGYSVIVLSEEIGGKLKEVERYIGRQLTLRIRTKEPMPKDERRFYLETDRKLRELGFRVSSYLGREGEERLYGKLTLKENETAEAVIEVYDWSEKDDC